jgi:thiamine biosynthesis lipoprotein
MSHWAPTSLLSRFNRAAAGTWTALPADFARVMVRALAIAETTGGAFDPAIGRLVDAWGFGPIPIEDLPGEPQIEAAMARSGWRHLALSTFTTPRSATGTHLLQPGGIALDLSGIAKGYAVDAVAALLEAAGFVHHLVEIGGELVGAGMRPDGDPWWVDLETPTGTVLPPLRMALHGMAVATSGDYRRGAHTLDPRTGRAIDTGIVSASVIHRTAMDADAWATALTVLGPLAGLELAREHGLAARLVTLVDGDTCEYLSPRLAAMLTD